MKNKNRNAQRLWSFQSTNRYYLNYVIKWLLRACCSSTGKWYLRWDLRSALSSSSSSCCRIRSYPWHSSRGSVAGADGVPAWPPHNTAPVPPGLANATACHTPKIRSFFKISKKKKKKKIFVHRATYFLYLFKWLKTLFNYWMKKIW